MPGSRGGLSMLICRRTLYPSSDMACLLFLCCGSCDCLTNYASAIDPHLLHIKHNTSQERLHATSRTELVSSCLFLIVDLLTCCITASPPTFILQTLHFSPIWWHYLDRASLGPSFKYKLHKAAQCLSPIPCPLSADATPEPAMSLETLARSIAHHQRARTTLGPMQVFSAC